MKIENSFASLWEESGILYFIYNDDVIIDLAAAMQIVTDRLTVQKGKDFPILCDTRGVKDIDISARRYLASEGALFIKAIALLHDNPLSRIFSEIYAQDNKLSIPTKICTDIEVALQFLQEYL